METYTSSSSATWNATRDYVFHHVSESTSNLSNFSTFPGAPSPNFNLDLLEEQDLEQNHTAELLAAFSNWSQTGSGFSNLSLDLPFLNGSTAFSYEFDSNASTPYGILVDANRTTAAVPDISPTLYPSGHTLTHIVVTAVFVTLLMIMVVVGNMLVIVAIVTEKALKTIQNWFIASLAVADFLLGLVVMPFSLAQELMGYWIFGFWWCEIYLAIDVLLCTSSIMNLCLISLDRYWSITQAVDYLKKRTPGRAILMIATVWILSFLISVPPLLGWKKSALPQDLPFCQVSDDTGYVIYSSSGSFYIPSVIMVFVYVRIYFAARSRARRVVKKHRPMMDPTKDKSTTTTSFSNASPPDRNKHLPNTPNTAREHPGGNSGSESKQQFLSPPTPASVLAPTPTPVPKPAKVVHSSEESNGETKDGRHHQQQRSPTTANNNAEATEPLLSEPKPLLQTGILPPPSNPPCPPLQRSISAHGHAHGHGIFFHLGSMKVNGNSRTVSLKAAPSPNRLVSQAHALAQAQAQILLADDMECLSELDHSSDSDQPTREGHGLTGFRRLQYLCNPPKKSNKARRDEIDLARVPPKPRDPEREKRRIARKKERRATLILGLIMASFILCWLPFFTMYLVRGLCEVCVFDELGFGIAFWLGYCNSALNPVIYTIFNKDFRKAFRKILFK